MVSDNWADDAWVWDGVSQLTPRPGAWMMEPRAFAAGRPGEYRGFRSAGANLLAPHRTGAIYVAQNATYASAYCSPEPDWRLWRLRLVLRAPVVSRRPIRCVNDDLRARLPAGCDAIVMPRGDGNMGNGPVIAVLNPGCVVEARPGWTASEVQEAIQRGRLDAVPAEALFDYPQHQERLEVMREQWGGETWPANRF